MGSHIIFGSYQIEIERFICLKQGIFGMYYIRYKRRDGSETWFYVSWEEAKQIIDDFKLQL